MKKLIATAAVAFALLAAAEARASLIFDVDTLFNGAATPTSSTPWLTATFESRGPGAVALTLTSGLEVPSEFISEVAFNVGTGFAPSSLTITQLPAAGPLATAILHTSQNAQNLTGGGAAGKGFDIRLRWATAAGPGRFDSGDVVIFLFSGTDLTAEAFDYANTGGADSRFAAHVQGIPSLAGGTASAGVKNDLVVPPEGTMPPLGPKGAPGPVVPEPASMLLLGTGLAGLLARRRRA